MSPKELSPYSAMRNSSANTTTSGNSSSNNNSSSSGATAVNNLSSSGGKSRVNRTKNRRSPYPQTASETPVMDYPPPEYPLEKQTPVDTYSSPDVPGVPLQPYTNMMYPGTPESVGVDRLSALYTSPYSHAGMAMYRDPACGYSPYQTVAHRYLDNRSPYGSYEEPQRYYPARDPAAYPGYLSSNATIQSAAAAGTTSRLSNLGDPSCGSSTSPPGLPQYGVKDGTTNFLGATVGGHDRDSCGSVGSGQRMTDVYDVGGECDKKANSLSDQMPPSSNQLPSRSTQLSLSSNQLPLSSNHLSSNPVINQSCSKNTPHETQLFPPGISAPFSNKSDSSTSELDVGHDDDISDKSRSPCKQQKSQVIQQSQSLKKTLNANNSYCDSDTKSSISCNNNSTKPTGARYARAGRLDNSNKQNGGNITSPKTSSSTFTQASKPTTTPTQRESCIQQSVIIRRPTSTSTNSKSSKSRTDKLNSNVGSITTTTSSTVPSSSSSTTTSSNISTLPGFSNMSDIHQSTSETVSSDEKLLCATPKTGQYDHITQHYQQQQQHQQCHPHQTQKNDHHTPVADQSYMTNSFCDSNNSHQKQPNSRYQQQHDHHQQLQQHQHPQLGQQKQQQQQQPFHQHQNYHSDDPHVKSPHSLNSPVLHNMDASMCDRSSGAPDHHVMYGVPSDRTSGAPDHNKLYGVPSVDLDSSNMYGLSGATTNPACREADKCFDTTTSSKYHDVAQAQSGFCKFYDPSPNSTPDTKSYDMTSSIYDSRTFYSNMMTPTNRFYDISSPATPNSKLCDMRFMQDKQLMSSDYTSRDYTSYFRSAGACAYDNYGAGGTYQTPGFESERQTYSMMPQAGYTSVIVDPQQYHLTNGYAVH